MTSWLRRKQMSMTLGTIEAKYITTSVAIREGVWLRKFLVGLFDLELELVLIYCDNQSCVKLSKNPLFHENSNNI
jgi:hypothetical protein